MTAPRARQVFVCVILGAILAAAWVLNCHIPQRTPPDEPVTPVRDEDGSAHLLPLVVGSAELRVEVAETEAERALGLMHRESLEWDRGMLFIFPVDRYMNFWMKNTYIPLSIAFIRSDGVITEIQHMKPLTTESHFSQLPGRYALEVNEGWYRAHGVRVGDPVKGLPPPTVSEEEGD